MNIVVIQRKMHHGSTYNITKKFIKHLSTEKTDLVKEQKPCLLIFKNRYYNQFIQLPGNMGSVGYKSVTFGSIDELFR